MTAGAGLDERAEEFARRLSALVSAFVGRSVPFDVTSVGSVFSVHPDAPVTLDVEGRALLSLDIVYRCAFDHEQRYLAVDDSQVKVHAGQRAQGEPLFRYEFLREPDAAIPAAHLHVHAHRDGLVKAMTLAGAHGAPRRRDLPKDFLKGARMSDLHFPLGGPRFRPGLEDVLQMVRVEFGVDVGPEWERALLASRENYRRDQTGSVVRDCPAEAVRVLRELGYSITEPAGGVPGDRVDRLQTY